MRDSYYVGLIILALHKGDCQRRPQLFIKVMKYGPGLRSVCMCVLPTHLLRSLFAVTGAHIHFQDLLDIFFFFFKLLALCPSAGRRSEEGAQCPVDPVIIFNLRWIRAPQNGLLNVWSQYIHASTPVGIMNNVHLTEKLFLLVALVMRILFCYRPC